MINLIIFDLDGVLIKTKDIHFNALNKALGEQYAISYEEHLAIYDGLKTNQKLEILTKNKGLPPSSYNEIWKKKQSLTIEMLDDIDFNPEIHDTIKKLSKNHKIAVCSNSINKTCIVTLNKLKILNYVDHVLSNEDVSSSKPHPEIFWKAMALTKSLPEETLILEDSPPGLLAAGRSSANVMRITDPSRVTYENILKKINEIKIKSKGKNKVKKWNDDNLNVLIPMAGLGSRFQKAGYTFPKPLIDVGGKPMIQLVVENINIDANYIYVVQKEHRENYNLDTLLNLITPNCKIIEVDKITDGAACTALLAKEYINSKKPLFFANSDQFVEWDSNEFLYRMNETNADGGIVTFNSIHPKWSFARIDDKSGLVTEVAEKNPISNIATTGFYYWKHGSDFVNYAEKMIEKNIRVNNEFYVCPVFNEAILDDKKIRTYLAKKMWGLGTPEDLNFYLKNY
jgi:HAD superfamily hydrolase (TIGR01509 family)